MLIFASSMLRSQACSNKDQRRAPWQREQSRVLPLTRRRSAHPEDRDRRNNSRDRRRVASLVPRPDAAPSSFSSRQQDGGAHPSCGNTNTDTTRRVQRVSDPSALRRSEPERRRRRIKRCALAGSRGIRSRHLGNSCCPFGYGTRIALRPHNSSPPAYLQC